MSHLGPLAAIVVNSLQDLTTCLIDKVFTLSVSLIMEGVQGWTDRQTTRVTTQVAKNENLNSWDLSACVSGKQNKLDLNHAHVIKLLKSGKEFLLRSVN